MDKNWSIGIMEYWNNGEAEKKDAEKRRLGDPEKNAFSPHLRVSLSPHQNLCTIFHDSNIPSLRYLRER
jgi:hypothetical protein